MKYCGNCGKQLEDDNVFCGDCGARQEVYLDTTAVQDEVLIQSSGGEDNRKATKFAITDWFVLILLIVAYPFVLLELTLGLLLLIPELLWWILFIGFQVVAVCLLWSRKNWKIWVRVLVTVLYVLAYFV